MIQEEFKFYRPCKWLQSYVRYYWMFKSNRPINTLTFPIGCTQIIFHKGIPLYIPELGRSQEKMPISGQVNFPAHLYAEGDTEMIVVVFQPYAMGTFLNVPTSLFYNQEISGYDLGNKGLNELTTQIFECEDNTLCVNLIEQWLLSQMTINLFQPHKKNRIGIAEQNIQRVHAAIKKIHTTPQTSITELSSIACLSKKQFERLFNSLVGINPKEYARITRFQKALELMQRDLNGINYSQIAYSSGYADQSHFIREFKAFSGHTPMDLLKVTEPYSDLFTNPV